MDGGYLTAVRTGAVSGVATKYLARKDSGQVVGIFGTGVQASMQLWAVAIARNISKALIYDISDEAANKFKDEMGTKLNLEIIKVNSPDEILEADIICTATSSATPIFDGKKVKQEHISMELEVILPMLVNWIPKLLREQNLLVMQKTHALTKLAIL